jgi:hypothetical protein
MNFKPAQSRYCWASLNTATMTREELIELGKKIVNPKELNKKLIND